MHAAIIILLSLLSVWLDIALSNWWPLWATPIFIWIGIIITILRGNNHERWLWIISCAAWSLYAAGVAEVLVFTLSYAIGGEICNYIYKRYLPSGNRFFILIPAFILAAICDLISSLINGQNISWRNIFGIIITTVIITIVLIIYDPTKKEKEKYF